MPKISTPFAGVATEVDEDEAAALERMGLLRDGAAPAEAAREPEVTVKTVFGRTVTVDRPEAMSLARQGLVLDTVPALAPAVVTPPPPPPNPPAPPSAAPAPKE